MTVTIGQLEVLLGAKEAEHLEFKEAKTAFSWEKLIKYCVALANERGGKLVLGVSNTVPRRIVGTEAFRRKIEGIKRRVQEALDIRVEIGEIAHPDGRVLVFDVPPRVPGAPVHHKGQYWMRSGESLVAMTPDTLRRIFAETESDFSAEICHDADINDLATGSIENFRNRWQRKSGNIRLAQLSDQQLLEDASLLADGKVTYAALILLGRSQAVSQWLPGAEVIFEYRSSEADTPYMQRTEYREGFFLYEDDIWNTINLRNDVQHYQDGLFIWDIPTFNEAAVREAVLNAISHRDYRMQGSVFVRQYPRRLAVVSPGGFPAGVTLENILFRQVPRNRRIAETLAKCGLVERSGQGVDTMFEQCIRESKPTPDYSDSDDYRVSLVLRGDIQDPKFLRFLEHVGKQKIESFGVEDLLALDHVYREEPVPKRLRPRLEFLREQSVVERIGKGRGVRYILSRRFHRFLGKEGVYTRKKGLDRNTNKELLFRHVVDNRKEGSRLEKLKQVLPDLTRYQVQRLLRELQGEGRIYHTGRTRGSRWYPGPLRE